MAATNLNCWGHVRGPRPFEPLARAKGRVDRRVDGAGRVSDGSGRRARGEAGPAAQDARQFQRSAVEGSEAVGISAAKDKAKPHAGAHRPLHPNPTSKREVFSACRCQGCGTDVSDVAQSLCESYDRIEIPEIQPTRRGFLYLAASAHAAPSASRPSRRQGWSRGRRSGRNLRALWFICAPFRGFPWRD